MNLKVRALPGGRRSEVVGRYGEAWKLRVRSAPEKGRANAELVALLAEVLAVSRDAVVLKRGHASRDKVFFIGSLEDEEVELRLERAASSP